MYLVKKVIETILVIIVGGVVTLWFFGTPELEYKSGYKDKYFTILSKAQKELTLGYRGEIIENISIFDFNIFNRTLKDISGVRLYFKITPKRESKVPEIISRGLYPPTPLPEIGITEKETGTENLYAFDIETLKRTGSNSFYTARFIFKGTETPEVAVSTLTKDVDIRVYSNWREYLIGGLITLAIMACAFVPERRLNDAPSYGTHTLYYYAIALACCSAPNYLAYLNRAVDICSLPGLVGEILTDLRLLTVRPVWMSRLQEIVAQEVPNGEIEPKLKHVQATLEKRAKH